MDVSGVRRWFSGVSQKLAADFLKWVFIIAGPTVIATLTGLALKAQGVSLDWWVLGVVFVGSLLLFIYASEKLHRDARRQGVAGVSQQISSGSTWSTVGWVVFGLAVPALFSVLVVRHVTIRFNEQFAQLREQMKPRILTTPQKEELYRAADRVPPDSIYSLRIEVIDDCVDCSGFAEGIVEAWTKVPRWKVEYVKNPTLTAQLFGVSILEGIKECPVREKLMVQEVLARVPVQYHLVLDDKQSSQRNVCTVFVGRRLPE
jgi:hypothetical protein